MVYLPLGLELLATSVRGRLRGSSNFKAGESCAAAKPSLVTFENNGLSPTAGGLTDTTAGLPKAEMLKHQSK